MTAATARRPRETPTEREAKHAWEGIAARVADIRRTGRAPPEELVERALRAARRLCEVRGRRRAVKRPGC